MKQEKAYLRAFDEYADALYRHCYFRVSDPERAKDIVSDAFTKTWDYLVKGNTIDNFKPLLYRTLNHLIIDEYRKKKTESLDSILDEENVPEGVFEELVEGGCIVPRPVDDQGLAHHKPFRQKSPVSAVQAVVAVVAHHEVMAVLHGI